MVHNGGRQHDQYPPPSKHARWVGRRVEEAGPTRIVESQPNVTPVLAILPFGETILQNSLALETKLGDSPTRGQVTNKD